MRGTRSSVDRENQFSSEWEAGLGRPELLRRVNARRVLRLLRLRGPCSRADLVRYSGLSAPTISGLVSYLQQKGLVEPLGLGRSSGGRRPSLLRFDASFGYVVGVDIGTTLLRFHVADLSGKVLVKWAVPTHSQSTPEHVSVLVGKCLRRLQRDKKIPSKKLLALAASVPGVTNATRGVVVSSSPLPTGWPNIALAEVLSKESGIPTQIENDVNLAAIAEHWCGSAQGVKNFVFLAIGTGVGAGIFINGRLHQGAEGMAGEIGYLYVPGSDENPLAIQEPGWLERVLRAEGIEHSWRLLSRHRKGNGHWPSHLTARRILDLAAKGQNGAAEVLHQNARHLADAIANICVVLDPSLVVFGGRIGSHPALIEATRQIVEQNDFCRPRLTVSQLGQEAPVLGAIWLALQAAREKILPFAQERAGSSTYQAASSPKSVAEPSPVEQSP